MRKILLSTLNLPLIRELVDFHEKKIAEYAWTQVDDIELSDDETRQLHDIVSHLLHVETNLMNEATVWARAIYPLLVLAEVEQFQAWSQVALRATLSHVELEGVVDGIIGRTISGCLETPYLLVLEGKRGLEGKSPRFQLLGAMLAAIRSNCLQTQQAEGEIYGCYTIGDDWTFLRAVVSSIDSELPIMTVETSREYKEKIEAENILKILKSIMLKYIQSE